MAQHKYSVGDRVRVLWKDAVYDAAVIKVHANRSVDVAYTKTDSVGVILTKEDHILQMTGGGEEKGKASADWSSAFRRRG